MKILHVEPLRYSGEARNIIEKIAEVDYQECKTQNEFLSALKRRSYDAVFVRLGLAINADAFSRCPGLKWVVTPTTGLDHIDQKEAQRRRITIVSLKGEAEFLRTITSTAEHTWALLLTLLRKVNISHADVLQYRWRREPFIGTEVFGKTLGIVGYGRLGKIVARYGLAFGMEVLLFDRNQNVTLPGTEFGRISFCDLDQLLEKSDVISLHLALNQSTRNFLTKARFKKMKTGAVLINTARGELIEEAALLEALENGRLAGAALDVLSGDGSWNRSIGPHHPLIEFAKKDTRLILTPHIGGYGHSSLDRTRVFIAQKFIDCATKDRSWN